MVSDQAPSRYRKEECLHLVRLACRNRHWPLFFLAWVLCFLRAEAVQPAQAQEAKTEQTRSEIPYREGTVVLLSDSHKRIQGRHYIKGHVLATYQDYVISGDEASFDEETREGFMDGKVRFSRNLEWLTCSRAEFNFITQTGVFYNASGYIDRQFYINSRIIRKTGPKTYQVEECSATTCEPKRPKWNFSASRAAIQTDGTARLHNTIFKVKGVPVFYTPYLIFPLERKERSSGFVPFHTGSSTSKGRVFSEGYYQTLGRSADLLVYGEYFSLRGLAIRNIFRVRPNPTTNFYLETYSIRDRLKQGGIQLVVNGESQLKNDWRVVARVNISSNFSFRQAFSDSVNSATIPQEQASAFLNRNHKSFSTNIAFKRDEVLFPNHPLVIRKVPSLEFNSLGTPDGQPDGNQRPDSAIGCISASDSATP
jgi:LPS-assembly protein